MLLTAARPLLSINPDGVSSTPHSNLLLHFQSGDIRLDVLQLHMTSCAIGKYNGPTARAI